MHKHKAFKEEHEWRLIYIPLFDDEDSSHAKNFTHLIKNKTIQPKLKIKLTLKYGALLISESPDEIFDKNFIIEHILLGPSHASQLSREATKHMLRALGKQVLIKKLRISKIPYRAKPGG